MIRRIVRARLADQRLDRRAGDREEADQVLRRRQRRHVADPLVVGLAGPLAARVPALACGVLACVLGHDRDLLRGRAGPARKNRRSVAGGFWVWRVCLSTRLPLQPPSGARTKSTQRKRTGESMARNVARAPRAVGRVVTRDTRHIAPSRDTPPKSQNGDRSSTNDQGDNSMDRRSVLSTTAAMGMGAVTGCADDQQCQLADHAPVFPVAQPMLPIVGSSEMFPVRRIYCIGRNVRSPTRARWAPTRTVEPPFFFQKPSDAVQFVVARHDRRPPAIRR